MVEMKVFTCKVCGKRFGNLESKRKMYCSEACFRKADVERRKIYRKGEKTGKLSSRDRKLKERQEMMARLRARDEEYARNFPNSVKHKVVKYISVDPIADALAMFM